MGEQLELGSTPGPHGNRSTEELRADYRQLTAGERIEQAAKLSYALTTVKAGTAHS